MEYTDRLKTAARNALRGRWGVAILTALAATLLGAGSAISYGSSMLSTASDVVDFFKDYGALLKDTPVITMATSVMGALSLYALVLFFVSGVLRLGFARFNLDLVDGKPVAFTDLFSQLDRFWVGLQMDFFVSLYTTLWSLLFVIPGIIKGYSYSMTAYILTEHPEMHVRDAIDKSRQIMDGNKMSLFLVRLSFIGWDILCAVPVLGIIPLLLRSFQAQNLFLALPGILVCFLLSLAGMAILTPYKEATFAAFYRSITEF